MTNLPLLKGISSLRFRRLSEEIWEFCLQFLPSFPYSFLFYVVAPLNLTHLNILVPCDSFGRLQNLDEILLMGEVFSCG
jgi:hypothetical protein